MIYRKSGFIFEDSGTVNPEEAYYVPLDNVTNRKKQDIKTMVDRGRYFSIFAPRQSGKTTFFKRMCDELHKDRAYIGIILNFQKYEKLYKIQFYAQIEKKLYDQLRSRLKEVGCNKSEAVEHFLGVFSCPAPFYTRLLNSYHYINGPSGLRIGLGVCGSLGHSPRYPGPGFNIFNLFYIFLLTKTV